ncbi:hypothetical protein [Sphingomonas arenae]|uniref:hypothetical protein n=1 Tax=Sphingomonas arenae TaxID=2812555 RepID=UPI00196755B2|nr:hypothetical protein [Sphingomonas arenae]
MSATSVKEARARGEADAAKARLMSTVEEVKERLAPAKLTSDAVQAVKDKSIVMADDTVTAVKDKPAMAAGIATATALFIARKPLFAAVSRWWNKDSSDSDTQHTNNTRARQTAGATEEI